MTEKFDAFGVAHRDTCQRPNWRIVPERDKPGTVQRCASCKVIWRKGDGQLTPRRANYGKRTR